MRPRAQSSCATLRSLVICLSSVGVLSVALVRLVAQEPATKRVFVQSIVIDDEEKAGEILRRLKNGDDFAALAKEFSIDPSASNGGYLGQIDPASLRPELRQALATLKPGHTSNVIRVATGFVILKLLDKDQQTSTRSGLPSQNSVGQGMGPNRDLHLAAKGAIQYPADVAGQVLADMLFQKFPKHADWDQDLQEVCGIRRQSILDGTPEHSSRTRNKVGLRCHSDTLRSRPTRCVPGSYGSSHTALGSSIAAHLR